MKMFLTRLGVNCRACVCGDFTQIDLPRGIESGLKDAITVLPDVEGVRIVSLNDTDIVRNSLVARIVKAYENAKEAYELAVYAYYAPRTFADSYETERRAIIARDTVEDIFVRSDKQSEESIDRVDDFFDLAEQVRKDVTQSRNKFAL